MLIQELVDTSGAVAATRSRKAKVAALAQTLARVPAGEVETAASYLAGTLRQRRTGVGWRGLQALPEPAPEPSLGVTEVHETFEALSRLSGAGSQQARADAVADLFGRATATEQAWLRGLVTGEVRQGALDALLQEAVASASDIALPVVRRAAMMAGSTIPVAVAALTEGEEALARFVLEVGRPVLPMLASSAPDVAAAVEKAGGGQVAVDTKLDGIRIQVHRDGDDVLVVSRSLDDITARLPEVVEIARGLPGERFVLDGEALALDDHGRPRAFQDTASRTAQASGVAVTPYFFDVLHAGGRDLVDEPTRERLATLDALVPQRWRAARLVTDDADAATRFADDAVAAGHEGVVVKGLDAPYAAGRRGSAWVKVKPVHTLDLVVLAVEWGSGRRKGWLSNIHLGARDDSSDTGLTTLGKTSEDGERSPWVMVGKTFKGMTDEILEWQTQRFLELETHRDGHVVHVRPEQVVEIAFDGVQRSTRYPGGAALRFARVLRYRADKASRDADSLQTVRMYLPPE